MRIKVFGIAVVMVGAALLLCIQPTQAAKNPDKIVINHCDPYEVTDYDTDGVTVIGTHGESATIVVDSRAYVAHDGHGSIQSGSGTVEDPFVEATYLQGPTCSPAQ